MKHTGQKIYELRKENNLKQKELASKLGLTPKMISFYEHGDRTPSRDVLCSLSDIFDVSIDYLLDLTNDPRTLAAQAREKFSFYIPYHERERYKNEYAQGMKKNPPLAEKIRLCELDMKLYFSRSVDASAFNFYHVDFPEYAAMLLNQKRFKDRYGEAYGALCGAYPPRPGIPEGRTYHTPPKADATVGPEVADIVEMIKGLPPHSLFLIKQFVAAVADLGGKE